MRARNRPVVLLKACAAENATVAEMASPRLGDRAQGHLFAAAGDHHRQARLLHRLRLEDCTLDVEIPAVEGCPHVWVADARRFITVYTLIATPARCTKPVIAAARGYCFGVGFELSLACDFRLVSETCLYALPEQRLGQIPVRAARLACRR